MSWREIKRLSMMLVGGLAPELPCPPGDVSTCTVVGHGSHCCMACDDAKEGIWSRVINGAGFQSLAILASEGVGRG